MFGQVLGIAVGALITWFCSWWYYRRAGSELRQEAAELRMLTTLVIRGLEEAGLIEVARDVEGKPTGGLVFHINISDQSGGSVDSVKL